MEACGGNAPVPKRVPVTIVTGFLGAGKSTLLNYILTAEHGKRIAVIENEFGNEKGIERLIARDDTGDQVDLDDLFIELSNGCICCSVRDDLVVTLEGLLEKSDKFDYIMIETTGVADPGPLVGVFWLDQQLESKIYLDGVVTVVDMKNLSKHLDDPRKQEHGLGLGSPPSATGMPEAASFVNEAQRQIAYADRVLLNKADLVDTSRAAEIRDRVKRINPFATILTSEFSKVDLDQVLNVRGYEFVENTSPSALQKQLLALEAAMGPAPRAATTAEAVAHGTLCHPHEAHDLCDGGACDSIKAGAHDESVDTASLPRHDPTVHSVVVRTHEHIDKLKFERWMGQLLWERSAPAEHGAESSVSHSSEALAAELLHPAMEIFRVKGCVNVAGQSAVHILQGVHETFEVEPAKQLWGQGDFEVRQTRIVFIGRFLDLPLLLAGVESCATVELQATKATTAC